MLAILLPFALLSACADDGETEPGAPDAATAPDPFPAPAPGKGIQLGLKFQLAPGAEVYNCQYFTTPADGVLEVGGIQSYFAPTSHHTLLFTTALTAADIADKTEPFSCEDILGVNALGVTGLAYGPSGDFAYPEGVAMKMQPGTVLLLQTHYVNATESPVDADVRLNLVTPEVPATIEAGIFYFYHRAINLPPGSSEVSRMRCEIPSDITLVTGRSHMHRRGIHYAAHLEGGGLEEPQLLYETTEFGDGEPRNYAPFQEIKAGQAIEYACDFRNDDPETVVQGPSAERNEMCAFFGTYYPRLPQDVEACRNPGSGPVFDGAKSCGETMQCIATAPDDASFQACQVATCEASSKPLNDYMECIYGNCYAECTGADPSGCGPCVQASCGQSFGACLSAGCN
jgi:hypothetical protein